MWKKDQKKMEKVSDSSEKQSPVTSSTSGNIAYSVVFDDKDGKLFSTPLKKQATRFETRPKQKIGIMDDEDEKLMAEIMDEIETKEMKEKLEVKLLEADIIREAKIKEKTERAIRSRKGIMVPDEN